MNSSDDFKIRKGIESERENEENEGGFLRKNLSALTQEILGQNTSKAQLNRCFEIILNLQNEEWNGKNEEPIEKEGKISSEERKRRVMMEYQSVSYSLQLIHQKEHSSRLQSLFSSLFPSLHSHSSLDESALSVCNILFQQKNENLFSSSSNFVGDQNLLGKDFSNKKENNFELKEENKGNLSDWFPQFNSFSFGAPSDSSFQLPSLSTFSSSSSLPSSQKTVVNNANLPSNEKEEEKKMVKVEPKKKSWFSLAKGSEESFLKSFGPFYLQSEIPIQVISRGELERSLFLMINQSISSRLFQLDEEECRFRSEEHGQFQLEDWKSGNSLSFFLNQLCIVGTLVSRLQKFFAYFEGGKGGLACQSFRNCMEENLIKQQLSIIQILESNSPSSSSSSFSKSGHSLFDLFVALKPALHYLRLFTQLCKINEKDNWKGRDPFSDFPKGVELLSHIYSFARIHHISEPEFVEDLFKRSTEPFMMEVQNWIFDGELNPFGELILQGNSLVLPSFLMGIGREIWESGELINWMSKNPEKESNSLLPFQLTSNSIELERQISFFGRMLTLQRESLGIRFDSCSLSQILEMSNRSHSHFENLYLQIESHFRSENSPSTELNSLPSSSHAMEKEEGIVPLERVIKALALDPISYQHRLINYYTLSHFISHLKMWDHLQSLRSFVLLSAGDFNDWFCSLLFIRLQSQPVISVPELNSILKKAFEASSSTSHFGMDRISLAVKNHTLFNNENAIELLEMSYKMDWPMNQMIRKEEMDKYNLVFVFLIKLKRVNFALRQIWVLFKNAKGNQNNLQIDLLRHRMNHFITTLQSYIINQIHNISWDELRRKMGEAKSVFEGREIHSNYLKNILKRCMLTEKAKPVMSILETIFALCLKFHAQIFSQIDYSQFSMDIQSSAQSLSFELTNQSIKSILSTQKSFDQCSHFLLDVLKKSFEKTHNREIGILLCTMNIPSTNNLAF